MKNPDRTHCIRCGTCCRKGGPALHKQDARLVESGMVLCNSLVTIREGEPAFDNVQNRVVSSASDIIKVRSKPYSQSCMFLNDKKEVCDIYEIRPIECRTLQCWDTTAIEELYNRDRLTRKDLLFETKDIWNLTVDHQARCSYHRIRRLLGNGNDRDGSKMEEIRLLIRYDAHLRSLLSEKGGMDPDMMDFLFGQPLAITIRRFGIVPEQTWSVYEVD